jgi:hypothetical protein
MQPLKNARRVNSPGSAARASSPAPRQNRLRREDATMARELDDVFARERARRAQDCAERFVDVPAVAHHVAEMNVRRRRGRFERGPARGASIGQPR